MADIFISYSRKDSEQALALAELLRLAGMDVWIDQHGLEAATSWSKEIVSAIWNCKAFVILLSESSLKSDNVVKELSIASEKRKPIVPLELHALELTEDFAYQLSGIQRVSYEDQVAIIRALKKLGIGSESVSGVRDPVSGELKSISHPAGHRTPDPGHRRKLAVIFAIPLILGLVAGAYFLFFAKKQAAPSEIKSLAVLPFECLSGDKETEYFADGMTATLIDILQPLQELRVVDRRSTIEFKGVKRDLKSIASALGVRYLVEGTIQTQGTAIKVTVHMRDAILDTLLMSKVFEGSTNDLITIQEQIARSVAVLLQLAFHPEGIMLPSEMRSAVPEAYNLCLQEASTEQGSVESIRDAIRLDLEAIRLDPKFAFPFLSIARMYGNINRITLDAHDLFVADSFFVIGKRLDTSGVLQHFVASFLSLRHKDFDRAIAEAKIYIEKRPNDARGYRMLALIYIDLHRVDLEIASWEEVVKRSPLDGADIGDLIIGLFHTHDTVGLKKYLPAALSVWEQSRARNPNEDAGFLLFLLAQSKRYDEACRGADEYVRPPNDAPNRIAFAASIYAMCGRTGHAMELLNGLVAKIGIPERTIMDLADMDYENLRSIPAFQILMNKQKLEMEKKNSTKNAR